MTAPVGARRPFWLRALMVLALLMPVLEVVVIVLVWRVIGWWTLLALLACFCGGVLVIRRASAGAVRELRASMATGRPPRAEVADAPQLVLGGLLLLIPGFITSLLGLILILPGMRSASRRLVQLLVTRRLAGAGGVPTGRYDGAPRAGRPHEDPDIIDGEIIEDEAPPRQVIEGHAVKDGDDDDRDGTRGPTP